jgi:phosphoenolpyruvate carboxylase
VLDEVEQGLGVVAPTLFEVVPWIYRRLEASLKRIYPDEPTTVPSFLRFGGWIGGDRDGNPNVTHAVTAQAIRLQQEAVLMRYLDKVQELGRRLSHAATLIEAPPQLAETLGGAEDEPAMMIREPFRAMCRAIEKRLQLTLAYVRRLKLRWPNEVTEGPAGVYSRRTELLADLETLRAGLLGAGARAAACGPLHDLIRLVEVFGLHLLTLDIRQHSKRHAAALDEIFAWSGVCPAYLKLSSSERFDLLVSALKQKRPVLPAYLPFSAETQEVVQAFRTLSAILEQQCPEAMEYYIISGCTEPAHLLEVLLLAREARLFRPEDGVSRLHIVPLFEDMESLKGAATIMQRLLHLPIYRTHLELRGNVQEVMIGYSDSNKETGFLQSAWALYKAQCALADTARRMNIRVQIFHGRGGAIGRGGGPANRAILAQPSHTVDGRLRFTEQGEMMADRYGSSGVAERHLEQIVNAVLRTSFATNEDRLSPVWERLLERVAERAYRHYRALVYQTPEFLTYFEQATPIAEIGQLKIASRPARRTGPNARVAGIDELRAIPWVFSWMQSRHTLPGWYGLGSAVLEYLQERPEDREVLMSMYQRWPFWRTLIDNAQMILVKADITIARLYADLVADQEIAARVFQEIAAEHERTAEVIRLITGQVDLLDNMPTLKRSIQRRNPYVDALSFVQLVLLRRLRGGAEQGQKSELLNAVLESISGIASGLKNTG